MDDARFTGVISLQLVADPLNTHHRFSVECFPQAELC